MEDHPQCGEIRREKRIVSKIIQKPHHVVISSTGTRVLMT